MSSSPNPPGGNGPVSLTGQIARILSEVSDQWIPPAPDKKWSHRKRFLPAAAGSLTFFLFAPWARLLEAKNLAQILPFGIVVVGVQLVVMAVGTLWFGYLASWGEHARSPGRLYFTGLLLPALTTAIITTVLR